MTEMRLSVQDLCDRANAGDDECLNIALGLVKVGVVKIKRKCSRKELRASIKEIVDDMMRDIKDKKVKK